MILNLLRVEELRVEDMMKRSFAEFHMQKDSQERKREMEEVEKKLQNIKEVDCTFCVEDLKLYFKDCRKLSELTRTVQVIERIPYTILCCVLVYRHPSLHFTLFSLRRIFCLAVVYCFNGSCVPGVTRGQNPFLAFSLYKSIVTLFWCLTLLVKQVIPVICPVCTGKTGFTRTSFS